MHKVEIIGHMDDIKGIKLNKLGKVVWLDLYDYMDVSGYGLSQNRTHFLITSWNSIVGKSTIDILDISILEEKVKEYFLKNKQNKNIEQGSVDLSSLGFYSVISIKDITEGNEPLKRTQDGDIFSFITFDKYDNYGYYNSINLSTGEILERFDIFGFNEEMMLAKIEGNLYLIYFDSDERLQITQDLYIGESFLDPNSEFCLISDQSSLSLYVYYLKLPFSILSKEMQNSDTQWKVFPEFNHENISRIDSTENEYEFKIDIGWTNNDSCTVILNIETLEYSFKKEDE